MDVDHFSEIENRFNDIIETSERENGFSLYDLIKKTEQKSIEGGNLLWKNQKHFPVPVFIKPIFLSLEQSKFISRVSYHISNVLEKIIRAYFRNENIQKIFNVSDNEKHLLSHKIGTYRNIWISRIDAIVADRLNNVKFIEFTTDSPGGPMWVDTLTSILENNIIIRKLRKKFFLSTERLVPQILYSLLQAYRESGGQKEYPNIALISHKGGTYPEFLKIVEYFKRSGYQAKFILPECVEYNGKNAYAGDFLIDIVYRRGWIKSWTDIYDKIKPLRQAYADGNVCVVNSIRSILGTNKCLLEHLENPIFMNSYTNHEKKTIFKNIPWTRLLKERYTTTRANKKIDLLEYIRKNRRKLVIKPTDLYGGSGVCIGLDMTQSNWDDTINSAITSKQNYVVQEYVPIPKKKLPKIGEDKNVIWESMKVNHNFFIFGGKYAGGWCRISNDSVINISSGAGFSPFFTYQKKG